jgi:predicted kinase
MTTLHLICGAAGAGKTTYALKLCDELGALHLSIDDWMVNLFGPDAPNPPQWPWMAERLLRCERQIFRTATEAGRRGLPVVLDLSFLRADQRNRAAEAAQEAGLAARLHLLDPDPETRWARVAARNEAKGETYRLPVTRPMFDFIESIWQRPSEREMADLDGLRIA